MITKDLTKGSRSLTGTQVDLGDDLLNEPTTISSGDMIAENVGRIESTEDRLQSAKILFNEGMIEQAKRVLHKILIESPHDFAARKALDDIHEVELKQIFSGAEEPRRRRPS